jgi:uridylate kinase
MYKRIVLKLSGEQLAGKHDVGIDPEVAHYLAGEIKQITEAGCEIAIVCGGGNMVRGAEVAGNGIRRVTADQMGMLSGLMNAMALTDIFESEKLESRCVSNIYAEQLAESYSYRLAEKHLENKRVLIIAGGSGRPYVTHDTAAVMIALELDCEVVLKSTKVDGVYDKDPNKFDNAVKIDKLSFQKAVEDDNIKVMDKAALGLAMEQHKPVVIFDSMTPGNLLKVVRGESVGTYVS